MSAPVHKWAPSIFSAYDIAYSASLEEPASSPAATGMLNVFLLLSHCKGRRGRTLSLTSQVFPALGPSVYVTPLIHFSVIVGNANLGL